MVLQNLCSRLKYSNQFVILEVLLFGSGFQAAETTVTVLEGCGLCYQPPIIGTDEPVKSLLNAQQKVSDSPDNASLYAYRSSSLSQGGEEMLKTVTIIIHCSGTVYDNTEDTKQGS